MTGLGHRGADPFRRRAVWTCRMAGGFRRIASRIHTQAEEQTVPRASLLDRFHGHRPSLRSLSFTRSSTYH
jgi:hypothetical protein